MGAPNVFRYYESTEKPKDAPKPSKPVIETVLGWLFVIFVIFVLGRMDVFLVLHEITNHCTGYYCK